MSSKNKKEKDRSDLPSNRSDIHERNNMEAEIDPDFQKQARKMLERYLDQAIQYEPNGAVNNNNSKCDNRTKQEHESESGIYLLKNSKQCAAFDEFRDIDAPMLMKKKPIVSDSSDSDSDSEDERIRSVAVQFNPTSGGFDAKTESTKNKR